MAREWDTRAQCGKNIWWNDSLGTSKGVDVWASKWSGQVMKFTRSVTCWFSIQAAYCHFLVKDKITLACSETGCVKFS
jgi:hypothetical protein